MKHTVLFATVMAFTATTAHANFLDKVNNALGGVNKVLSVATGTTAPSTQATTSHFANATDAQMQKIVNAVNQPTNTALDSVIAKASPNIAQVLLLGGCATSIELEAGALQSPQASSTFMVSAMTSTTYHPKSQCMTVQNIGSWSQPAKNSLKFKVVYSSDVSGETVTRHVEMLDEYGNGNWLVKRHDFY
ncbi:MULTISPECIES: hypothetical protein [Moraxella]|uniref:Uncharacterized protein n=2 Tax=Moraxella TaxID=475 RepID=A0A1B8PWH3_MORLA|nr:MULTISPECIES: hypothetical protein [Moraxella]MBE9577733.1 hypothetical protein [Moraxella sp. K1664]MBE9587155.1 hypothetical protein [Moraxella sp. K1630]MBE9595440.1 hypothetical protein [Moraxella sp. K2450]MDH9217898.1 hypothetical protein [Moraxella lacunata]MDI4483312.1 hypothetical protein [Moraxella lacunata]